MKKKLCVFCGSAQGNSERYVQQAQKVGELMASLNVGLVYGGATVGVMGAIADSVLSHGGHVIGVIPKSLVEYEVAHYKVTKLHIVEGMHERKKMMYDFSDAFLVLPGGMGTLDEMFEILTWSQLKLHSKPIYILNEFGFYDFAMTKMNVANSVILAGNTSENSLAEIAKSPKIFVEFQNLKLEVSGV
jgi:uncharacterized protein (TIGR00730 family)